MHDDTEPQSAPDAFSPRLVFPEAALARLPSFLASDHLLKASVRDDPHPTPLEAATVSGSGALADLTPVPIFMPCVHGGEGRSLMVAVPDCGGMLKAWTPDTTTHAESVGSG